MSTPSLPQLYHDHNIALGESCEANARAYRLQVAIYRHPDSKVDDFEQRFLVDDYVRYADTATTAGLAHREMAARCMSEAEAK